MSTKERTFLHIKDEMTWMKSIVVPSCVKCKSGYLYFLKEICLTGQIITPKAFVWTSASCVQHGQRWSISTGRTFTWIAMSSTSFHYIHIHKVQKMYIFSQCSKLNKGCMILSVLLLKKILFSQYVTRWFFIIICEISTQSATIVPHQMWKKCMKVFALFTKEPEVLKKYSKYNYFMGCNFQINHQFFNSYNITFILWLAIKS